MNIAIIGYGKMGKMIEEVAQADNHKIKLIIDNAEDWKKLGSELSQCDVAIEFSQPNSVIDNIYRCFEAGVPIVTGTTGWYERMEEVKQKCNSLNGSLFYASNFSIGVNIFMQINQFLSKITEKHPEYIPTIDETHHIHKLDAPSGTAITLAEGIVANNKNFEDWSAKAEPHKILINSHRENEIVGTHTITWKGKYDSIVLTHEANSRKGFAKGALTAAKWIQGRKGVFTMKDMLLV